MSSFGFVGAPLSRLLWFAIAITSLLVLSTDPHKYSLSVSRILGSEKQWWRLVTSVFALSSVFELFAALYLVWAFRIFERHMGVARFGSFLLVTGALTKIMELALCLYFPDLRPTPGPLPLLTALATMYYGYIPLTVQPYVSLWGLHVTEKVAPYLLVLVLVFGHSWSSIVPSSVGLLVALLYCSGGSPFQKLDLVGKALVAILGVFRSADQIAGRRTSMAALRRRSRVRTAQQQNQRGRLLPPDITAAAPGAGVRHRAVLPAPNEDDIALLMSFGFDRNTVIQVLRSAGNDAEAAANTLLGH